MKELKFFDCSACIGLGGINREIINHENYVVMEKVKEPKNAAELLAEMDYNGIDKAIVYHQAMKDVSVYNGNARILDEIKGNEKRLIASMSILPSVTDADFGVKNLEKYIKENNIFGVRIFPRLQRYMTDRITVGDIFDYLTKIKMPVYISPDYGWDLVFDTMKEFPDLTAVLTNYGLWGSDRFVYPLVNAYKNFYVDTSDFQEIRGVEYFVKKFGDERMLFGTNFPMDNMGGPIAALVGADISFDSKRKIAGENIERLIAEVRK